MYESMKNKKLIYYVNLRVLKENFFVQQELQVWSVGVKKI